MSLWTTLIDKNSHAFVGIYFIFLKKRPKPNLKEFCYQILTSKTHLSTFLQINCSNFRLKLCQRPQMYKICQTNQTWRGLGLVRSKKVFPETIINKIFKPNSSFHVKYCTARKVQFLFFRRFLLVLTKFSFCLEDWALGNNLIKFWDFPDIS